MTVQEAVFNRRTIRKFRQTPIPMDTLRALCEAGRVAPSGANLQPVKFKIIVGDDCEKIFPHTRWAGYLPDGAPKDGERPTAYILLLADTEIRNNGWEYDIGAAAQNIQLCAWAEDIGVCWMGSIDREKILEIAGIDSDRYVLSTLLALGYRGESSVSEDYVDSVKYYYDENNTLHVPKRTDIIL